LTSSGDFPGEFQAGDVVGGTYIILDYIGRGAMGHLYHVRHNMLNTEYALKTLSSDKVTDVDWKRFQNEAQNTATMSHPNVVSVYNSGYHDRRLPFYVMDLLHGLDLGQKVRADGPLEIQEAVAIFIEVCAGIGYAHKKGIIHRDIKPGNIFLLDKPDPAGARVKVVDFGIAKLTVTKNQDIQSLTGVGDVVGTPYYMSPEQCMAMRVDARSDIYSLGCTLFEALTGALPFRGRNATEIMILHQSQPPPSLTEASGGAKFPASLEYIIATALAKEPSERYQSMDQLAVDLAAVIEGGKPIVVAPGGAVIQSIEEPATVGGTALSQVPKKQLLALVVPVVAGLVAIGAVACWHFNEEAKKARQLPLAVALQKYGQKSPEKLPEELSSQKTDFERATAVLERAKDNAALQVDKPFCKIRNEKGQDYKVFNFPKDPVIGQLRDYDNQIWVKASGEVKFKRNISVMFMPDAIVLTDPDCLKRFRSGDIYGIDFGPSANTQTLIAVLNIPGIKDLDCSKSKPLADMPVNILKQFHDLNIFTGSINQSDGNALAQADCWANINEFYLPKAKNVSPLLKELQKAKNLKKLGLGPSQLTFQDYKSIASMSKLEYLDINRNPVTNRELEILTDLHKLDALSLINTDVDINALDTLRQFKVLKHLYISSKRLTQDDFRKIKNALPKADPRNAVK
jgi:serine/threonine protein kinase